MRGIHTFAAARGAAVRRGRAGVEASANTVATASETASANRKATAKAGRQLDLASLRAQFEARKLRAAEKSARNLARFDRVARLARNALIKANIPVPTRFTGSPSPKSRSTALPAISKKIPVKTVAADVQPESIKSPAPFTPSSSLSHKKILLSVPQQSLVSILPEDPFKTQKYRLNQLRAAIYARGVTSISDISEFPKSLREKLEESFQIGTPESISETRSKDGTCKFLVEFPESISGSVGKKISAAKVECVYIPNPHGLRGLRINESVENGTSEDFSTERDTATLNLEAWEMTAQVMHGMRIAGDFSGSKPRMLSNIVLMGQGEPLHNFKNLKPFMNTLIHELSFHPSKITLSTSGIAPLIPNVATDLHGCSLAVSLHAANDDLRSQIMPINKQYNLSVLMESLREYLRLHPSTANSSSSIKVGKRHKRITFEYVMLKGVNDSVEDAKELVRLLKTGLRIGDRRELATVAHVNLIPFHKWEGSNYECSDEATMARFRTAVGDEGLHCTLRTSRGVDVLGACGQLRSMDLLKRIRVTSQ